MAQWLLIPPLLAYQFFSALMPSPAHFLAEIERLSPGSSAKVSPPLTKALTGGTNWLMILMALMPLILQLFGGGGGNLTQIIDQIIAILNQFLPVPIPTPPTPTPTPTPAP